MDRRESELAPVSVSVVELDERESSEDARRRLRNRARALEQSLLEHLARSGGVAAQVQRLPVPEHRLQSPRAAPLRLFGRPAPRFGRASHVREHEERANE